MHTYSSAVPDRDAPGSAWRLTVIAAAGALLVTAAVIGLPSLNQSSRSLQELLLATGLGLVAVTNLLLAVLPRPSPSPTSRSCAGGRRSPFGCSAR